MPEITPQRKQLLEEMYALADEHFKQRVREEPEVVETSLMLVIKEHVKNWESNFDIGRILDEAVYSKRLQAAREFLARERETALPS